MYELIAAGLVIAAGVGGWFARRILSAAPPSEETMRGIARQLGALGTRLAKVETKLESRSVDNLWKEHGILREDHKELAKSLARSKADVARPGRDPRRGGLRRRRADRAGRRRRRRAGDGARRRAPDAGR